MLEHSKTDIRKLSALMLLSVMVLLGGASNLMAQAGDCVYLKTEPSIASATGNFRAADLVCAEKELIDLLSHEIRRETRADAHLLLASIYFVAESDPTARRMKVKKELVELYLAYPQWRGQLEIATSEFRSILSDAREMAQWRFQNAPDLQERYQADMLIEDSTTAALTDSVGLSQSGHWYTKWWAIGSGASLFAIAFVLMRGAPSEEPEPPPAEALPDFPSTP